MLRSFGLTAAVALPVVADEFSYFCQVQCGDKLENSCNQVGKCNVTDGCSLVAMQTFTFNDGVCEAFMGSGPVCSEKPAPGVCFEAIDFQLVWNREKDAKQYWKDQSSHGFTLMVHDSGAIFAPGHNSFAFHDDVMAAVDSMLYKSNGTLDATLHQVLTKGLNGPESDRVIHSIGSWGINGTNTTDVPFYARWVENVNAHWVVETFLSPFDFESLAAGAAAARDEPLFDQISERSASLSKAYNSGNRSQLQGFYMDGAVIVPQGDRPFEKGDIPTKTYLGKNAKLETKIVTKAPGSEAVHEVGFSDSTGAGYLARWVQNADAEWVVESQVFAIFPKVTSSTVTTQILI